MFLTPWLLCIVEPLDLVIPLVRDEFTTRRLFGGRES
jgi:hypothetical protein